MDLVDICTLTNFCPSGSMASVLCLMTPHIATPSILCTTCLFIGLVPKLLPDCSS